MERAPRAFTTNQVDPPQSVGITKRSALSDAEWDRCWQLVGTPDWSMLTAAYGSAVDVGPELWAVCVGMQDEREAAWWELWGDIHHQGTVYDATVQALPVLIHLAKWRTFPDRAQALFMLRECSLGDGTHAAEVRRVIRDAVPHLIESWDSEANTIQRAQLWLAGAFKGEVAIPSGLLELLPSQYHQAWEDLGQGPVDELDFPSEEAYLSRADKYFELEAWAMSPFG